MKLIQLLEYNLQKTMETFGEKLKAKMKKDRSVDKELEPEEFIKQLEIADPTHHKSYVPWLVKLYVNTDVMFEDMTTTVAGSLDTFNKLKVKNKLGADADIGKIKDRYQLNAVVREHEHKLNELKVDNQKSGKYEHVFKGKTIDIVLLQDYTAAKFFAEGTNWCTSHEHNWNHYSKQGPLYVIIPKDGKKWSKEHTTKTGERIMVSRIEKYQLHLASGQCKDIEDATYKFSKLVEKYPEVADYFRTVPEFKESNKESIQRILADEETRKKFEQIKKEKKKQQEKDLSDLLDNILSQ